MWGALIAPHTIVLISLVFRLIVVSFTQPDDTAVLFLLLLTSCGLEGVEIPTDAEPQHAAAILAIVHERIDWIV